MTLNVGNCVTDEDFIKTDDEDITFEELQDKYNLMHTKG